MSCQLFRPMLGVPGCKGFGQCPSFTTRFPQPLHLSFISLSCFCVSQPCLYPLPAGTARVYVWGTRRGTPKNPQYTLKNEGIPRRAGDAHWSAVSCSPSSERGVWVIYPWSPDAGCVVPAHQHCKWQHGCAYGLTYWLLRRAVVREGPIPYHRWAGLEDCGRGVGVALP